ncbi:hypothetical protein BGZ76_009447 [Entomortierella beljakovae]|nr:hypothetical protein BGZ76_009447 [Entomortierella beljakovae]
MPGLGLAAAAHVHLFNWSFGKIEAENAKFIHHETNSKIDCAAQTLLGLDSLSELLDLANAELLLLPESHSRSRGSRESGKSRLNQKDKNKGKAKVEIDATNSTASANHNQRQDPSRVLNENLTNYHGGASSSSTKRYSVQRHRRSSREVRRSTKRRLGCDFSADSLERWSDAYEALRKSQETFMKLALQRMKQAEPFYFCLLNDQAISVLLGSVTALHYVLSTERFSAFLSKCSYRLGSFFNWSSLTPLRRLYIPWGLGPRRSIGAERVLETAIDVKSTSGVGPRANSYVSIACAFLQLAPTIFITGIHFFAATKAQLALYRIHKENQRQVKYTRRLSVISTFLSIREQRLRWLAREMREFEEAAVDEGQDEDDDEDEYEDIVHSLNDGPDESNLETREGCPERSDQGTSVSEMRPIPTPTIDNSVRPRYLAGDVHYRIFSLLQGGRGSGWPQNGSHGQESNDNRNERLQSHQFRQANTSLQLLRGAFGPDLRNMNLDVFLNCPEERRQILRLEFEGIREELMLFRDMALRTKF